MTPVPKETLDALSWGIKQEAAAYVFYVTAAKKPEAEEYKDILHKLAYEEKEHFHILERQHDSLMRSEKWITTADIMKQEGLPEIPEDMMRFHKDLLDEIEKADSTRKILDIAYGLEEDAHKMYQREAERTESDEGKKIFNELSKFEQGHMALIEEMMKKYA